MFHFEYSLDLEVVTVAQGRGFLSINNDAAASTKIGAPLLALKALPNASSVRSLARATLVLLTLNGTIDAAEPNVCTVVGNPSGFDHRQLTLEGIVAGLTKSTSRSGHKQMTFLLRSPVGSALLFMLKNPRP